MVAQGSRRALVTVSRQALGERSSVLPSVLWRMSKLWVYLKEWRCMCNTKNPTLVETRAGKFADYQGRMEIWMPHAIPRIHTGIPRKSGHPHGPEGHSISLFVYAS
jgi:hypothetical protein